MSEYRFFFDENGTADLNAIDPNFPGFCLTGVLFEKTYYHSVARVEVDKFKNDIWHRTDVILHSRDIRKQNGDFAFLHVKEKREEFYLKLNRLIYDLNFQILCVFINKPQHLARYKQRAIDPYCLSLEFVMERMCLLFKQYSNSVGYMMGESRGKKEDRALLDVYHQLTDFGNPFIDDFSSITNFHLEKKEKNIAGLQIADLVGYPLSTKILHPERSNPAFDVFNNKIVRPENGNPLGYGIKIFPSPSVEIVNLFLNRKTG